jgi:TrmH family RNA methyltransferase
MDNNLRKLVRSLADTKGRRESGLFVAEGTKCIGDIAAMMTPKMVLATDAWWREHQGLDLGGEHHTVTRSDLERMSSLKTPSPVMAVFSQPQREADFTMPGRELVVALDRVQDPGNLGTIVRACDWWGVKTIWASQDTVDVWNPKVVQATMGSIARVSVCYVDLAEALAAQSDGVGVYGTFLDGESIYDCPLAAHGVIVMGNEGRGVSDEVARTVNRRLLIPRFPDAATDSGAESLNVAVATAITLAEFRRRMM